MDTLKCGLVLSMVFILASPVVGGEAPTISGIAPQTIRRSAEVKLMVLGSNFDDSSWVVIEGAFLKPESSSDSKLEVNLSRTETSSVGQKRVKVHNIVGGGLSNEVLLTIE